MRFSFSRLTLTVATTALLAFAAPVHVKTAAAHTLAPTSEWAINNISVEGGQAYCTMVRQYEADSIVTFAKNAQNEGTIALDFQRDAFDDTRSYPVTLAAGDVSRQYAVRPAGETAIIMRTGADDALFAAIRQAGALNITIDNEKFAIDLSGYQSAFDELVRCSGAKVAATTSRQVRPPVIDGAEARLSRQDEAMNKLASDNDALVKTLEGERASFRKKLAQDQSATVSGSNARENQLLAQLAAAETSNAELLRRISSLELRGNTLNPDVEGVLRMRDQEINALMADNGKLQKLLEVERAQRTDMTSRMANQTGHTDETATNLALIRNLETQIASLQNQNNELKKSLADERVRRGRGTEVREVIKEVRVPVASGETSAPELEARLVEAETAAITAQAERDEYRALLQRERARLREMSDIGQQIGQVDSSQTNMTETIRRLEEEKVNLVRQLEFARRGGDLSKVDTASSAVDADRLQRRLEEVMQESDTAKLQLRSMAAEKQALENQLSETRIQLAEAQRQKSSDRVQQIAAHGGTGVSADIRTLESEIAALEAQNLALREDLASRSGASGTEYAKRLQSVEQENIRLSRELASRGTTQVRVPTPPVETIVPAAALNIPTPPVAVAENRVSAPVDLTPSETRRENSARLRNKITGRPVETVSVPPAPVVTAQVQPVAHIPVIPVAPQIVAQPQMTSLSGDEIRQLVSRAQIPMATQVERVGNVSGPDFAAFRWDTGHVYGSAEQSSMPNAGAFQQSVQQYISKTQSRCAGSFDQTTMPVTTPNGLQASAVDIACVDHNAEGAAASVLFFAYNGMFYAVAHEADLDSLQTAMDMRDKLAGSLGSVF